MTKPTNQQEDRFELWLDVQESRTTRGELYLEYDVTWWRPTLRTALAAAARACTSGRVYLHDRESGEVWAYPEGVPMALEETA